MGVLRLVLHTHLYVSLDEAMTKAAHGSEPAPSAAPTAVEEIKSRLIYAEVNGTHWKVLPEQEALDLARRLDLAQVLEPVYKNAAEAVRVAEAALKEAQGLLREFANRVERLAFDMEAPNVHTPQFVQLAHEMRLAAIRHLDSRTGKEHG